MNLWLSVWFNLTSAAVIGVTAVVVLLTPGIDASLAGFTLAFVTSMSGDVCDHELVACLDMETNSLIVGVHGQTVRWAGAESGK